MYLLIPTSIDVYTLTSIQMLILMLLFRLLYRDKEGQVSKILNTKYKIKYYSS